MPTYTQEYDARRRRESTATGWFIGIITCLALFAIGYLVFTSRHPAPRAAQPASTAFVKLTDETGSGSGVHIGNGYILTAAHVANDAKDMVLKASDGSIQSVTPLWENKTYDVALMRASRPEQLESATLDCSPNFAGQDLIAEGNPSDLEFVRTYGKVIGAVREYEIWREVVPVDLTVVPGMSGGAVTNDAGDIVGITVAVMNTDFGIVGLGYIVPASAICMLLDRS